MSIVIYLRLDDAGRMIAALVVKRALIWRCFWSPPRIGHNWDGGGLTKQCRDCPKAWVGNF